MKRLLPLILLSVSLATPRVAQAVLVNVTFDKGTPTSNSGTILNTLDQTNAGSGSPANVGFSVTGLTIDSFGSGDDAIAFTFTLAGTGFENGFLGFGDSGDVWGINSTVTGEEAAEFDLVGEGLNLSLASSSVTLGVGGTETGSISFLGFTGFDLFGFAGDDRYNLAGTSADGTALIADPVSFSPSASFTLSYNAGDGFGIRDIGATFDVSSMVAVPEPSALLLGSLVCGMLGANRVRKRFKAAKPVSDC